TEGLERLCCGRRRALLTWVPDRRNECSRRPPQGRSGNFQRRERIDIAVPAFGFLKLVEIEFHPCKNTELIEVADHVFEFCKRQYFVVAHVEVSAKSKI